MSSSSILPPQLLTKLKRYPNDGRLLAKSVHEQNIDGYYGGYQKLEFKRGETLLLVSCSLHNSYMLFGCKYDQERFAKQEIIPIYAIESTTLKP
mmetsp:Transcript_2619/g.2511  ORF Transcript_2619/g.2511 Transcript_2619/m.2511 type:complete len:94 (-) Transcript_2619:424-705(-)